MTELKKDSIALKLYSNFRHYIYVVFLKHQEDGWELSYFGNKIKLDKLCSNIERYLGSDGTEFPLTIELDFYEAWEDITQGVNASEVKQKLQHSVDKPVGGRGCQHL